LGNETRLEVLQKDQSRVPRQQKQEGRHNVRHIHQTDKKRKLESGDSVDSVPVPDWVSCEGTEQTIFFGRKRPKCEAQKIQEELLCWEREGDWYLNETNHIIDDMDLYLPCSDSVHYAMNNQCAWMLDGNGLKYDWLPKDNCSIQEKDYRKIEEHMPDLCERFAGESESEI